MKMMKQKINMIKSNNIETPQLRRMIFHLLYNESLEFCVPHLLARIYSLPSGVRGIPYSIDLPLVSGSAFLHLGAAQVAALKNSRKWRYSAF